jgi:hypothetical protein
MPSMEMLKKLLDEFTEKEAHAREEINVITEQIGELEKRILASHAKLSTVATDREKVRMMQSRYSGGSTLTTSVGPANAPSKPSEETKEKETRSRPGRTSSSAASAAATPAPVTPAPFTAEIGIPPAPLNVRASSTRIPAMKAPEPAVPATSSSPFLSTPEPVTAPNPAASIFSPMDIFGAPAEETPAPEAAANTFPTYAEPQAAETAPLFNVETSDLGQSSYTMGVQPPYTSAQPQPAEQTAQPLPAESSSPFFNIGASDTASQPDSAPQLQGQPYVPTPADVQQAQPQAAENDDNAQIQDLEDEPDDTVKSINDALRGLFR